jgi:WhiB family transcriptional regulator, redox-sensing transcriptional regulator
VEVPPGAVPRTRHDIEMAFYAALMSGQELDDGTEAVGRPAWQARAACAAPDVDPRWFFHEGGRPAALAKDVCRRCPVAEECLAYALGADGRLEGTWAGLTRKERRDRRLRPAA